MQLSHKYEAEHTELKERISSLREKLDGLEQQRYRKDAFLAAVRKFMEMGALTAPLLQELIDHIDMYETEGAGKNRTQRIVIYYRFWGISSCRTARSAGLTATKPTPVKAWRWSISQDRHKEKEQATAYSCMKRKEKSSGHNSNPLLPLDM